MIAAVDIGTNSVRLLVAKVDRGALATVLRRIRITRLGQGVDRTGILEDAAIERTVVALTEFATDAQALGVIAVRVVATSAVRCARNREAFVRRVEGATGWRIRIVSGEEEAQLSFAGAVAALSEQMQLPEEICVVDIGGGSTELVWGTVASDILWAASIEVGVVRLTESFITEYPVPDAALRSMEATIRHKLMEVVRPTPESTLFVGVGGTITTAAAIHLELDSYDPCAVTGVELPVAVLSDMYKSLQRLSRRQLEDVTGLQKGREDVIVAGIGLLCQVLLAVEQKRIVVCDGDLLLALVNQEMDG